MLGLDEAQCSQLAPSEAGVMNVYLVLGCLDCSSKCAGSAVHMVLQRAHSRRGAGCHSQRSWWSDGPCAPVDAGQPAVHEWHLHGLAKCMWRSSPCALRSQSKRPEDCALSVLSPPRPMQMQHVYRRQKQRNFVDICVCGSTP